MDLRLLYSNFIMDNRELMFHTTPDATHIFQDDRGFTYCAITAFQTGDLDISRDPLSTNRRLTDSREFQMFGDHGGGRSNTGRDIRPNSRLLSALLWTARLRRTSNMSFGLSLGSAENFSSTLPQDELHLTLCDNSLCPTLTLGRPDYWSEITTILRKV